MVDDPLKVSSHGATQAISDGAVDTTNNGGVTLKGRLRRKRRTSRRWEIARRSAGVMRVEDDIQVMEPLPHPLGRYPYRSDGC